MKALVLAAGFSTRLYPLTENMPKALLKVHGKAIIEQVLEGIFKTPVIDGVALVTNHKYVQIFQEWINAHYPERNIQVLDNGSQTPEDRLGAIGDLRFSLEKLGWADDVLVVASDTLTSLDISEFVSYFLNKDGVLNAVYDSEDIEKVREKLGNPVLEREKIVEFLEKPKKPKSTFVSIPYYIFPKRTLPLISQYLSQGGNPDAPGSIISWLIGKVSVNAFLVGKFGYYHDVGTLESLEHVRSSDLR